MCSNTARDRPHPVPNTVKVLESVEPPVGGLFVDLGSGTGKAVVAAAMSGCGLVKCKGTQLHTDTLCMFERVPLSCVRRFSFTVT